MKELEGEMLFVSLEGGVVVKGMGSWYEVSGLQDENSSGDGWKRWLHSNVKALNVTELLTEKQLHDQFCYVYCTKIKNKNKRTCTSLPSCVVTSCLLSSPALP